MLSPTISKANKEDKPALKSKQREDTRSISRTTGSIRHQSNKEKFYRACETRVSHTLSIPRSHSKTPMPGNGEGQVMFSFITALQNTTQLASTCSYTKLIYTKAIPKKHTRVSSPLLILRTLFIHYIVASISVSSSLPRSLSLFSSSRVSSPL